MAGGGGAGSGFHLETLFGATLMDLGKHVPVMAAEYWVYALASVISIATLTMLYLDPGRIRWPAWW